MTLRTETRNLLAAIALVVNYGDKAAICAIKSGELRGIVREHAESNGDELCVVADDLLNIAHMENVRDFLQNEGVLRFETESESLRWIEDLRQQVLESVSDFQFDCESYEPY